MRKKKMFHNWIAFMLAMLLMLGVFCCTAYAAPGDEEGTSQAGDPAPADGTDPADTPDDPAEPTEQPTVAPTQSGEVEPTDAPDDQPTDHDSRQDELPDAEDGDVVPATAIDVPAATVTDASLLSGIVMWLCVAVGIAVVVGVLVSKRTRRRGQ